MPTQKEIISKLLTDNPNLSVDECIKTAYDRFHITIASPLFYSVRSDMGYGSRRNGRIKLTAESVNQLSSFLASTNIDGRELLRIIDEMGFATFKESLKVVAHMNEKV